MRRNDCYALLLDRTRGLGIPCLAASADDEATSDQPIPTSCQSDAPVRTSSSSHGGEMKFSSALREVHLFLIRGDGPIPVHMNRKDEAYTGYPTGVFPKVKDSAQPKVAKRGDQGDAAIGSTSAVNGTELPPPPPAA